MRRKNRLLGALLLIFIAIAIEGGTSFFSNHSYYGEILLSRNPFLLIVSALGCSLLPLLYLTKKNQPQLLPLLGRTAGGLSLFMILHEGIMGNLVSLFSIFPLLFNTLLLLVFALGIFAVMFGVGHFLGRKLKLFEQKNWQELVISFGLGLVLLLVVAQILMGIGAFWSALVWGLLIACGGLWYREHKHLESSKTTVSNILLGWKALLTEGKLQWIFWILAGLSFAYFFFGFSHSYIPYPTARDASHEYMYTPKIITENHGVLWENLAIGGEGHGSQGAGSKVPYLWHSFIALGFALWNPLAGVLSIASDTFAVNLNFWSGIFALLLGLGLFQQTLTIFSSRSKHLSETTTNHAKNKNMDIESSLPFVLGWSLWILWLTSGMGAFLLFVDNKTDIGVLILSMLGFISGFRFLSLSQKHSQKHSLGYLLLSSIFFAFAVMAKPTAFIDFVVFGLILAGFWLNTTSATGLGIMALGAMGILKPLYASAFLSPNLGAIIMALGALIFVGGLRYRLRKEIGDFRIRLKQLLLWSGIFILTIITFKGPWVAIYQYLNTGEINAGKFITSLLLTQVSEPQSTVQTHKKLLAQTGDTSNITLQHEIDRKILNTPEYQLSLDQCQIEQYSTEELNQDTQSAPGSSMREDFGRYVGFDAKEFKKSGIAGLLLKSLFRKNNHCYGFNKDAVLLCKNPQILTSRSLDQLQSLQSQLSSSKGAVGKLISATLEASDTISREDGFKSLETYVNEHSIKTTDESIFIPYRYLVPINAVFNRSIQNLSSYYTDIGLIWIFVFVLVVATALYAMGSINKKLLLLTVSVGIGRAIWWTIAAAIIWYGIGLILLSIVVVMQLFQSLEEDNKNSELSKRLLYLLLCFCLIQGYLNFARIASQATTGPFGRYKSNTGIRSQLTDELGYTNKKVSNYNAQDVFNLQFGHYSPFLDYVKERKDEDGILIAGTYSQYFIKNQKNIYFDGLLNSLWEDLSDYNSCKSYHRLQNKHVKYIVIDPNIGTIGRVGAGNESLFHRFFAKLNADESEILTPGGITMLTKLLQEGYLKLIYTNNLGAKYAFSLSNDELRAAFGEVSDQDLILIRGKLAVAKFFVSEKDTTLLQKISELLLRRLTTPQGIEDVANMLSKTVNGEKLLPYIQSFSMGKYDVSGLSQSEKVVLANYLGLMMNQNQNGLKNLLEQSLFGSSQIIALERL